MEVPRNERHFSSSGEDNFVIGENGDTYIATESRTVMFIAATAVTLNYDCWGVGIGIIERRASLMDLA